MHSLAAALFLCALAVGICLCGPAAAQPLTCRLDVDGNGQVDALTDGILVVRHLFGFTGTALVEGALGVGATRPTAEAISEFLAASACAGMLDADGSGATDALTDGVLILRYLFGFTDAALVSGALAPAAARRDGASVAGWLTPFSEIGPDLELVAPLALTPLVSEVKARLRLRPAYRGTLALRFSLIEGPSGMTIDEVDGTVVWTPPRTMEGQESTVRARCTDGTLSAEVSFSLLVAATTPIATAVSGATVTVTQAGSLEGLALTLPAEVTASASQVEIRGVRADQTPPVPAEIRRLSDFFRVSPVAATGSADIVMDLPTGRLPTGRSREELRLYAYVEQAIGVSGPFWMQVRRGLDLLPGGMVRVTTPRLGHVSFIGLPTRPAGTGGTGAAAAVGRAAVPGITCERQRFSDGTVGSFQHICTVSGEEAFVVTVRDLESDSTWKPIPPPQDVADWLRQARGKFRPWAMGAAAALNVVFETISKGDPKDDPNADPRLKYAAGYCAPETGDLHISNAIDSIPMYRNAIVHEYFHHAQRQTGVTPGDFWPLFNTYPKSSWFIEGTAKWFEDEVFDDMDSYRWGVAQPFPHILEVGLASPEPANLFDFGSPAFPYSRFAFFKWLRAKCGVLNFNYLLNPAQAYEETGLENLAAWIGERGCNFGQGFGSANAASFATALLGYASATTWVRDLSMLDSDENPQGFEFAGIAEIEPSPDCTLDGNCPNAAYRHFTLPAGGARSIVVKQRDKPPADTAFLRVTGDRPVWVSLWSAENIPQVNAATLDLGPLGAGAHATWFRSTQEVEKFYGYSVGAPAAAGLFATIVNPEVSGQITVLVRSGLIAEPLAISPRNTWLQCNIGDGGTFSIPMSASGGKPPYTWSIVSITGDFPPGALQATPLPAGEVEGIDPASGAITITIPPGIRRYHQFGRIVVQVTDTDQAVATLGFYVAIGGYDPGGSCDQIFFCCG